jgi:hypothetical protein
MIGVPSLIWIVLVVVAIVALVTVIARRPW